jgi:hypothetical protein
MSTDAFDKELSKSSPHLVRLLNEAVKSSSPTVLDNPKKAYGDAKPCLHYLPMNALLDFVAPVGKLGADKYGYKNWRKQPVDAATYYDAALRHMIAWMENMEDADPESGVHHLGHAICDLLIILDGLQRGQLADNRAAYEVKTAGVGQ